QSFTIAVTPVPDDPVIGIGSGPRSQSIQYSDPITPVSITGSDPDSPAANPTASAGWKTGTATTFTPGLPGGLTLVQASAGNWTVQGKALTAPGAYTIKLTITGTGDRSVSLLLSLTVTQEDARSTYTGALFASASSPSSGAATVTLSATVQDITAVAAAADPNGGDIRNARVTLVNRDAAKAPLCSAPVGMV